MVPAMLTNFGEGSVVLTEMALKSEFMRVGEVEKWIAL